MARTRGATAVGIQSMDGELIDKYGNPIRGKQKLTMADVVVAEPQPPVPPAPPVTRYICNDQTLMRDLDGWELARLLNIAMGGALEISLDPAEYARVSPDLRRHFRPVRGE